MQVGLRFFDVVMEESARPFQYGTNDCCTFCISVYKKAFGIELANPKYNYSDRYHAARVMVKEGRLKGMLETRSFSKINKYHAKPGDVVVCEKALGIWVGTKAVFAGGSYRTLDEVEEVYTYTGE
jgi:cell wall-associated NlpC family hydrolase